MLSGNVQHHLLDRIVVLDCSFKPIYNCDKKTFMSYASLFNYKLADIKNAIIEQIYILNKLYDKQIDANKKQLDAYVEDFISKCNINSKSKVFYKTMLNSKYKQLKNNIQTFSKLEGVVKENIEKYYQSLSQFNCYINEQLATFELDEKSLAKIAPDSTKFNQSVPCVQYCKDDLNKKVRYLNSLYGETTKQKHPTNIDKGDITYGNS